MNRDELKSTIVQLRQQLQSGEPLDGEVAELLQQLTADLTQLTANETAEKAEQQSLLDRLSGMTTEFEESHPQLAETIGRVAEALSRIGI